MEDKEKYLAFDKNGNSPIYVSVLFGEYVLAEKVLCFVSADSNVTKTAKMVRKTIYNDHQTNMPISGLSWIAYVREWIDGYPGKDDMWIVGHYKYTEIASSESNKLRGLS